jgi:hypothetical protein
VGPSSSPKLTEGSSGAPSGGCSSSKLKSKLSSEGPSNSSEGPSDFSSPGPSGNFSSSKPKSNFSSSGACSSASGPCSSPKLTEGPSPARFGGGLSGLFERLLASYDKDVLTLGALYLHAPGAELGFVKTEFGLTVIALDNQFFTLLSF